MPSEMLDQLLPGGPGCELIKPEGLSMTIVVRSACSIRGMASLSDRAAGRLEFQATATWRPSVSTECAAGTNRTGRPVTNRSCSANE